MSTLKKFYLSNLLLFLGICFHLQASKEFRLSDLKGPSLFSYLQKSEEHRILDITALSKDIQNIIKSYLDTYYFDSVMTFDIQHEEITNNRLSCISFDDRYRGIISFESNGYATKIPMHLELFSKLEKPLAAFHGINLDVPTTSNTMKATVTVFFQKNANYEKAKFSNDKIMLALLLKNNEINIFDRDRNNYRFSIKCEKNVSDFCFSLDKRYFAIAQGGKIIVHDIVKEEIKSEINIADETNEDNQIVQLQFTPDLAIIYIHRQVYIRYSDYSVYFIRNHKTELELPLADS